MSLILAITVVAALSACGGQRTQAPVALCIILGNHANSKAVNLSSTEIAKQISKATSSCGFVSVVCADGSPYVAGAWTISPPAVSGLTASKLKQISSQQTQEIIGVLPSVKAEHEEVDMLKAIEIATRSFADAPEGCEKQILVLDSGIPTAGVLNFSKADFLNADPTATVDLLSAWDALPSLSETTVTWIGLADVASPQKEISPAQKTNLQKLWTVIIERAGGKANICDTLPSNTDNAASDFPKVSAIDFAGDETDSLSDVDAVVFRNIQFLGDTTEYADPNAVAEILKPVADYLKGTPDFIVLVVGTTAGENSRAYCLRLSSERADAVRRTLIALGVAASQVIAIGVGYDGDPWHLPDTASDGTLIESIASQNRKVVLMDATSAEAKRILNTSG